MKHLAKSMILAAGKGSRMGTISHHTPKPLVRVGGRTMIDRALDHIRCADLGPTVVNTHHLGSKIEEHLTALAQEGQVVFSDERASLLETGGGVKKALPMMQKDRIIVINGDAVWTDGSVETLGRLWRAFQPETMDILLLAVPTGLACGYDGPGDLFLDRGPRVMGLPSRLRETEPIAPHMFGGIFVAKPHIYDETPEGAWSNRLLFQSAAARGTLYALEHTGNWMHVGTPESIKKAEDVLSRFESAL